MSSIHTKPSWVSPLISIGLSVVVLLGAGLVSQAMAQGPQDFIVTFRDGTIPAVRAVSVRNAGATLRFDFVNGAAVTVPNENALGALRNDPSVLSIIPDRPAFAFQNANAKGGKKPDKPGGGGGGGNSGEVIPSGVLRVGVPVSGSDGTGVGVAIIDSGIDFGHQDLAPAAGVFDGFGGDWQDYFGHGTHVAGIVAANEGNQIDGVGVAPKATLHCVRVLDGNGFGSDSVLIAGLEWVLANRVSRGIRVANISLGRPGSIGDNPMLHQAITNLYIAGVVVVVAAGNDPNSEVSGQIPGAYPEVLSVASTTAEAGVNQCRRFNGFVDADTASYFTTDGAVTISAPGEQKENINKGYRLVAVGMLSTQLGGGTTRKSDTSMAAPHVAGIVARMLQATPETTDVEYYRSRVETTAYLIGMAPLDSPSSAWTDDFEKEGIAKAPPAP